MTWLFFMVLCYASVITTADFSKAIEQTAKEYGYVVEAHTIYTEDDYILTYHRLPQGKGGNRNGKRPPILLVPGIFTTSFSFMKREGSLVYALADSGYDVWIANYRGSYYSRKHKDLDPDKDSQAFWKFTLTELGEIDLPAGIDYILDKTGYKKLGYIGFSMGTTMFWILGATKPEYMEKISLMLAITPVTKISKMAILNNFISYRFIYSNFVVLRKLGFCEILMYNEMAGKRFDYSCNKSKLKIACRTATRIYSILLKGLDMRQLVKLTSLPPSGISINVLLHYMQIAKADSFQKFDYGKTENNDRYKTEVPPKFDLKKITCPVFLIYSEADDLATAQDIQWLSQQLPQKPTRLLGNSVDHFTHMDFAFNENLPQIVTKPLVEFFQQHLEKSNQ